MSPSQLPWSSIGDLPFPDKAKRQRRRVHRSQLGTAPVEFPIEEAALMAMSPEIPEEVQQASEEQSPTSQRRPAPLEAHPPSLPNSVQTPQTGTSEGASETASSTDLTTPSPTTTPQPAKSQPAFTSQSRASRHVVPVVPAVPLISLSPKRSRHSHRDSLSVVSTSSQTLQLEATSELARRGSVTSVPEIPEAAPVLPVETTKLASPPAPPKSWADLVRSNVPAKASNTSTSVSQPADGLGPAKSETLSDVLNTIDVTSSQNAARIAFLKPRGLVNTGNMCYMNSVFISSSRICRPRLTTAGAANFSFLYSILRVSRESWSKIST